MKSMLISTAIILAIGLGGSFIYHLFAPHAARRTPHAARRFVRFGDAASTTFEHARHLPKPVQAT